MIPLNGDSKNKDVAAIRAYFVSIANPLKVRRFNTQKAWIGPIPFDEDGTAFEALAQENGQRTRWQGMVLRVREVS